MDKLWAMKVFVRVMECGSLSRAAESLDLANATVTSSLRNLEKHLGTTLVQRNSRHLHLTEEGRLFLPRCQEILRDVARAEAEITSHSAGVSGMLRVEAPFAIGQNLLCPALIELTRRHPGLSVSVTLTNSPNNMIERATDIAIRMDSIEDADLVARPIYEARYLVCGTPLMAQSLRTGSPRDLDPAHCLGLFSEGNHSPNPWVFTQGDDEVVIRPRGPLLFNNTESLIQAALQDVGLIYVLDLFVADYIKQGKLVELFPEWRTTKRTFHAVTVKSRFAAPRVRTFIDFLLEIFDARRRPNVTMIVPIGSNRKKKKSH
ncbi:LysR family transcriptional regulator [Castellaniella sp. GW247-6E4]|uniref:LysR family transcriptional regulator n=1 Tax=Castellaniella sp. GW247-6E4 TaxID=3140380 RepID=UPI0033162AD9